MTSHRFDQRQPGPGVGIDWVRAFPAALSLTVQFIAADLPSGRSDHTGFVHETNNGSWSPPTIGGEVLFIPSRMYSPVGPRTVGALDETGQALLACMYSRHHDGHVRQAAARALIKHREPFVAPFLIQLLGEYVLEIVVDISDWIDTDLLQRGQAPETLIAFGQENPDYMKLTTARANSYWVEYHWRRYTWPRKYPAIQALATLLESSTGQAAYQVPT